MALSPLRSPVVIQDGVNTGDAEIEPLAPSDPQDPNKPAHFDYITENVYISHSLQTSKDRKRSKRMVCECQFDPETDEPDEACGESCLNRLLMIECGSRCPCREYCTNKKFQRAEYANVEVFKTEKKGWGLRALEPIPAGTFVMEYCGEVCSLAHFEERKIEYVKEKRRHYYFMSLTADEILDATRKGNLSRYINHSCDPNSETQKWTVNGKLRIGFFSLRDVKVGEELTFDYKFQRFGDVAQKCYCGSANCRGYLGQTKQTPATLKVVNLDRELGSPRSPSSGTRRRPRQRIQSDADSAFEKDLYDIVGSSWRLKSNNQVLAFCRLMLQAETPSQRIMLLQVLQATDNVFSKKFISFHGLRLLWSWMVDSSDFDSAEGIEFRVQVLQTLEHLPIANKNQLDDNKILPVVKRWAEHRHHGKQSSGEESTTSQQLPSSSDEQPEAVKDQQPASSTCDDVLEGTVVTEADSVCELTVEQPERGVVRDAIDTNASAEEERDVTLREEVGVANAEESKEELVEVKEESVTEKEESSAVVERKEDSAVVETEEEGVALSKEVDTIESEKESTTSEERAGDVTLTDDRGVVNGKDESAMEIGGDLTLPDNKSMTSATEKILASAGEGVEEKTESTVMMEEDDVGVAKEGGVATVEEAGVSATSEENVEMAELEDKHVTETGEGGVAIQTGTEGGVAITTEDQEGVATTTEGGVAIETAEGGVATTTEGSVAIETSEGVANETSEGDVASETTEGGVAIDTTEGGVASETTEGGVATATEEGLATPTEERDVAVKVEGDLAATTEVGVAINAEGGVVMTEQGDLPVTDEGGKTMTTESGETVTETVGVATSLEGEGPADSGVTMKEKSNMAASLEGEGPAKAETREADSVCEMSAETAEGGVVNETRKEEEEREVIAEGEASREAEARESTSDQSQDEDGAPSAVRDRLSIIAEELLEKWKSLKEVFRIPKRTPLQRAKASPINQRPATGVEDETKEGEEMDDEEVLPPRKSRHRNKEHQSLSHHSSPRDRRSDRQFDHQSDRSWSRSWKGLLPTPKRAIHTASPSQRIPPTVNPPPVTTPTMNPALAPHAPPSHAPPSTMSGYAPGSHTHTYTASFPGNAPVQNTVIVQQPAGQSIYVQQQVFQDGLKTTILPTQYATPTPRPPHPAPQQYVQLNPTHLPTLPPLPATATAYAPLSQQTGGDLIPNPVIPVPPVVVTTPSYAHSSVPPPSMPSVQPQYYQQQHQQQVLLQSSTACSQIGGAPLLPQQQQPTPALNTTLTLAPLPPPPPNEDQDLPLNWKTARDTDGKIYYYHAITRKTQWERPTEKDVEGTITMDLGTPEPESDGEEDGAPRGPRTPPDDFEGYGGEPRTPEGMPPPLPKGHKGPRTPSPDSHASPRRKSHRRHGSRHHHSRVKGPHTPSPPRRKRRRSKSSSKSSASPSKTTHSPSPHSRSLRPEHHTPLVNTSALSPSKSSSPPPQTTKVGVPSVTERLATMLASTESQVDKSGSHSPNSKSDTPNLHSLLPIPIPPVTSIPPDSQQPSTPPEPMPLDTSLLNESTASEGQDELTPPPKKKRRGEGKTKSKSSKSKDDYRHKLSKVVIHCLDQHRKTDCKYGRITCADDFKYLARRLTHGLAEKEFNRKGAAGVGKLELTDSVKAKVRDYIRQYMKKFGSVYVRSSSSP